MAQSLIESGHLQGSRGAYRLVTPIEKLEVPATVQAALAALRRAEFIHEQAIYPVVDYSFKHPLTQEVALGSQLKERRRQVHAAVARAIEQQHPDHLDERAPLLAHDWEEAGEAPSAARWHRRAAEWVGYTDVAASTHHWGRVRALRRELPDEREAPALGFAACFPSRRHESARVHVRRPPPPVSERFQSHMTDPAAISRILTLVFTDLADSTALKTQRGDQAVGELITRHGAQVRRLAADSGGRIIDWAGDGCSLTFETPSAAVLFAPRLQQTHRDEPDLPGVRTGLHMGEVSERCGPDGDVAHPRGEGLAVDLAARISGLARPGQILMSSPVADSARQRLEAVAFAQPILWRTHGSYALKGFDEALQIREAGLEGMASFEAPAASEKARPVLPPAPKSHAEARCGSRWWRPSSCWARRAQLSSGRAGRIVRRRHRLTERAAAPQRRSEATHWRSPPSPAARRLPCSRSTISPPIRHRHSSPTAWPRT